MLFTKFAAGIRQTKKRNSKSAAYERCKESLIHDIHAQVITEFEKKNHLQTA